ncbi:hypothetical protein [Rugamonas sp.]|uniref:hypothetical protein n=1 Tax=Rugamonas sp. TaxID=1926287 RepID=UPI0025CCF65B|nr:hypothetical protein [Rugamonas sp.]
MNNAPDTDILQKQLESSSWQLAGTVTLGAAALALAIFGQDALAQARPIFPMIDQIYGSWQSWYIGALIILGLVWAVAMVQKINTIQYCMKRLQAQRRIAEQHALRASRAQAAKRPAPAQPTKPAPARAGRSSKFDY